MSETKLYGYLPWVAVAVLCYALATQQVDAPKPDEPKPVAVSLEKATASVFPSMRAGYQKTFLDAAIMVEKGEVKTDKELFEIVSESTKLAREQAKESFDGALEKTLPRNESGSFTGVEVEAGKVLRRVYKSW